MTTTARALAEQLAQISYHSQLHEWPTKEFVDALLPDIEAAFAEVIEACAIKCDEVAALPTKWLCDHGTDPLPETARQCATAIRSLLSGPAATPDPTRALLIQAWHIAKDGCLLPPDGGSPTADEVAVSTRIANRIRSLMPDSKLPTMGDDEPDDAALRLAEGGR